MIYRTINPSIIPRFSNEKKSISRSTEETIIKRFCRTWISKINVCNFYLQTSRINAEIQRYFKIYSNGFTLGNIRFPSVYIYSAKSVIRENISFHVTLISESWNSFRLPTKFFCFFEIRTVGLYLDFEI